MLEAILRHPALYTGPRMVKPPVVYTAGLLRGLGRGIDTSAWVWLSEGAGQRLFYPPNVAGWDDTRWLDTTRSAAAGRSRTRPSRRSRSSRRRARSRRRCRTTRRRSSRARSRSSATRRSARETHAELLAFARGSLRARPAGRPTPTRRSSRTPSASSSPCPPTSRPAEDETWPAATSTHAPSCSAAGRRGRAGACPRSSPACRRPPARASTGARSSPAALGLALAVYGGRRSARRLFEEGIAAAAAAGPSSQRVLVSVFLDGGADALSLLSPPATRSTASCGRGSRSPPAPGRRSPRTRASRGTRRSPRSRSSTPRARST